MEALDGRGFAPKDDATVEAGTLLAAGLPARFTPRRLVGSGGFGTVYEAWDAERNEVVAVKRLDRVDPSSIYRFKQEFRVLAESGGPNLVRLHELVNEGTTWLLVMAFVDGVRLDTFLRGRAGTADAERTASQTGDGIDDAPASLPATGESPSELAPEPMVSEARLRSEPAEAAVLRRVFGDLVLGVIALHSLGVLHRDLKPSNVLVAPDGKVTLLDFGLALSFADDDPAYGRAGTPTYMSPEQTRGGALTAASDWYSVGVMLYEALVGHPPFSGTAHDVLQAKRTRIPRDPRLLRPGCPSDLAELALELLERDPSRRPHAVSIARRLGVQPSLGPRPTRLAGGPFVGRAKELAALVTDYERSRAGATVVSRVRGPSGFGKTTLVRRFLMELGGRDEEIVILEGRCLERAAVPFKALDDLVDALGRFLERLSEVEAASLMPRDIPALVRLFPSLARLELLGSVRGRAPGSDPHEWKRRAYGALREIFARIVDSRPLVLVLEDAHFGDRDSAELLHHIFAHPEVPPLPLIVTYRSDAEESEIVRLVTNTLPLAEGDAIDVGPLEPEDAIDLAGALLRETSTSSAIAEKIASESAHNPLLIFELARVINKRAEFGATVSLADVVASRAARLDEDSFALLRLLAVAEGPMPSSVLARALDYSMRRFYRAFERLRDERFVSVSPRPGELRGEIFHARIRSAVLATMTPEEVRRAHLTLAVALEREESAPELLFHHHREAGETERSLHFARIAGERALQSGAFEQALSLFKAALALLTPGDPESASLEAALATALAGAGRGSEAAGVALGLAERGTADAAEWTRFAGQQFLRSGHMEEALVALSDDLRELSLELPRSPTMAVVSLVTRRAWLRLRGTAFRERRADDIDPRTLRAIDLCWALANGLAGLDVVRSAHYHVSCLQLALRAGEPYRVTRSLGVNAVFSALEGEKGLRRAELVLERAKGIAERIGHPHARGWVLTAGAVMAWSRTELEQCEALCDAAIAELREQEYSFREIGTVEVWFALHASFLLGHLDRVAERAPACAREAEARGDRYTLSTVRSYILPLHWAARGRPDEARREANAAVEVWPRSVFYHQHWAHLRAHCFLDLYESTTEDLVTRIEEGRRRMKESMQHRIRTPRLEAEYLLGRAWLEEVRRRPTPSGVAAVRKSARRLDGEHQGLASVYAKILRAGLDFLFSPTGNVAELARLEGELAGSGLVLHEAAAKARRARLEGVPSLEEAAHASLRSRGVAEPNRFIDMLFPRLSLEPSPLLGSQTVRGGSR